MIGKLITIARTRNEAIDFLECPSSSVVTLIIRAGQPFVPQPVTRLQVGDELLIVTTSPNPALT